MCHRYIHHQGHAVPSCIWFNHSERIRLHCWHTKNPHKFANSPQHAFNITIPVPNHTWMRRVSHTCSFGATVEFDCLTWKISAQVKWLDLIWVLVVFVTTVHNWRDCAVMATCVYFQNEWRPWELHKVYVQNLFSVKQSYLRSFNPKRVELCIPCQPFQTNMNAVAMTTWTSQVTHQN